MSLSTKIYPRGIKLWGTNPLALTSKHDLISNKCKCSGDNYRKHQLPSALTAEGENYRKKKLLRLVQFKLPAVAQQSGKLFLSPAVVVKQRLQYKLFTSGYCVLVTAVQHNSSGNNVRHLLNLATSFPLHDSLPTGEQAS